MFQKTQSKNIVGVAASSSGLLRQSFTVIRKASWGIASAAMVLMSLSVPTCVKADPPGGTTNWTKSFEDTFNNGFDQTKWKTNFWWDSGYINDSSVSYYSSKNISVSNGNLTLTANNNSEGGLSYTGGIVTTYGKFYQTYGYFEARVKVATGNGMDPYFSLVAEDTSWPPETNIFEIPGAQSPNGDKAWMTTHYKDTNGNVVSTSGTWTSPTRLDQDYHTYGLLWQPGLLVWYIDGVERYRTTTGVPNKDNYIALALGVFNDGGQHYWSGDPTNTNFPKSMNVSWVRAWKRTNG